MNRYKLSKNTDYPNRKLFVWFLVFSDIINCFALLKKQHFMEKNRKDMRIPFFIQRLTMGYVSEAQKTINNFLDSDALDDFCSSLSPADSEQHKNLLNNWELHVKSPVIISEKEHGKSGKSLSNPAIYSNAMRNFAFHFAERKEDTELYKNVFLMMCEDDFKKDEALEYTAGEDNLIESVNLIFVDELWTYVIGKNYDKNIRCGTEDKPDDYSGAVESLLQMFELVYEFAIFIWTNLEYYLKKEGIIIKFDSGS